MATVKRFDVCTPRPKAGGDGTWWHRVGSAVENDRGHIHVYFDSVPIPDDKGSVHCVLFEPKERNDAAPSSGAASKAPARDRRSDDDSEIPF